MRPMALESQIPDFTRQRIDVGGVTLSVHIGGSGPALLLLHGYPQNHMCWLNIAPHFAKEFTCIIPDLRGYGDSHAPHDTSPDHQTYSKRQMARDMVGLLDHLGLERAHILGHDRFWRNWTAELAHKAYHWTFLAQPAPLPERMIDADPVAYMEHTLQSWTNAKSLGVFPAAALDSYRAQARDPARIHAMCADYRAGATYDRIADEADRAAGRKIEAPLRFLWAQDGFPGQTGDPAELWRGWAQQVSDRSCVSGHFATRCRRPLGRNHRLRRVGRCDNHGRWRQRWLHHGPFRRNQHSGIGTIKGQRIDQSDVRSGQVAWRRDVQNNLPIHRDAGRAVGVRSHSDGRRLGCGATIVVKLNAVLGRVEVGDNARLARLHKGAGSERVLAFAASGLIAIADEEEVVAFVAVHGVTHVGIQWAELVNRIEHTRQDVVALTA